MNRFESLVNLGGASAELDRATEALAEAVAVARGAGATWSDIGDVLGVTKQTAWEKYWRVAGPSYHTA